MPRIHHVKKAMKDNAVCKKGESYYWWQLYKRPKQLSLTRPRPSQLTGSEYLRTIYHIQENMADVCLSSVDEVVEAIDGWASEIREAGELCLESRENMPESLQDSETGQMLEERADLCEAWATALEDYSSEIEDDEDTDVESIELPGYED